MYKSFRMRKFIKSIKDHKKNSKASIIKTFMKGYIVAKKWEPVYIKMRLTNNLKELEKNNIVRRQEAFKLIMSYII